MAEEFRTHDTDALFLMGKEVFLCRALTEKDQEASGR